jgi:hypothetical protein
MWFRMLNPWLAFFEAKPVDLEAELRDELRIVRGEDDDNDRLP